MLTKTHAAMMNGLSGQLDICLPFLTGKLVYIDYPVHWNIGDLLIWQGAKVFLRRNGLRPTGAYSINNIGQGARRKLEECETICFHGGGNLGDLWPWYQENRERMITAYPRKRIVMFPQSVHFKDKAALARACAVFRAHPDLHIFIRDHASLAILQGHNVPNVRLCPDMAHALWDTFDTNIPHGNGSLYLMRRDDEAREAAAGHAAPDKKDWTDLLTGSVDLAYKFGLRIDRADGGKGRNLFPAERVWDAVSRLLIARAVDLFAPYETIVTDRLHAMILALLMDKTCIAHDNSYGKLSTYYDCWLQDSPKLTFTDL